MANILKNLVIDVEETLGNRLVLLEVRPYASYKEGVRGDVEGIKCICLSERCGYEKVDVKIAGILELPFEFSGSPVPVTFVGIEAKIWQDWSNRGEIKLSVNAKDIKLVENKRIRIGGERHEA